MSNFIAFIAIIFCGLTQFDILHGTFGEGMRLLSFVTVSIS